MQDDWFQGFETTRVETEPGIEIHARIGGTRDKPPLLLLHGFPQTHAMWHRVARQLAPDYFIVLADLRGYGESSKPPGEPDHANYGKRAMASDMARLMTHLGAQRFFLCGHDRGGRVACRLALDHPERVLRLALLDIVPTLDMYEHTDMAFARAYYHWFFFIQPAPLPEMLVEPRAREYLHTLLGGWGGRGLAHIEPQALAAYERWFVQPASLHAAFEDYRAGAGIDMEHEREDRARGRRIACDLMLLWGERGVVGRQFDPLALWGAQCAGQVSGQAVPSGHFIPEELPRETADALWSFLR